jgi:hypothetical protein
MFHTPTTYAGAIIILLMLIVPPWTVHTVSPPPAETMSDGVSVTTRINGERTHAGTEVQWRPIWSPPARSGASGQHAGRIDFERLFLQILIVAAVTGTVGAFLERNG